MTESRIVAVLNSSEDTTDMLRVWLEMEGYTVVTAFTHAIRDGKVDFEALMRQHRPRVIVYDVSVPYDANWRLFRHIQDTPAAEGVTFVVTTTNGDRLREVAGQEATGVLEIVGKPYDADELSRLVGEGFKSSEGGDDHRRPSAGSSRPLAFRRGR